LTFRRTEIGHEQLKRMYPTETSHVEKAHGYPVRRDFKWKKHTNWEIPNSKVLSDRVSPTDDFTRVHCNSEIIVVR
jgi:NADH:ubiquinone oxidoreductase subunit C